MDLLYFNVYIIIIIIYKENGIILIFYVGNIHAKKKMPNALTLKNLPNYVDIIALSKIVNQTPD